MRRRHALPGLAALLAACSPTGFANFVTPPGAAEEVTDLAYGPLPRYRLDLYLPPAPRALLVFFHGGSWQSGSRRDYPFLGRALAAEGLAVAIPDYRLWPEAGWPGFVEDAALAVRFLAAGGAPQVAGLKLHVGGHSAGGYLAACLALDPTWLGAAHALLAGAVLMSAPINWQPRRGALVPMFAAAPGGRIMAVRDRTTLATAPPTLLLHGGADSVVQPDQAQTLASALEDAGRPVRLRIFPGVGHIGVITPLVPAARRWGLAEAPVGAEITAFTAA